MIRLIVLCLSLSIALSAREPKQITLANQGTISGMYITRFRTKRIAAYIGIPYAQPPVDFRRFMPPEYTDLPQWEGVKNATIFAPDCMQSDPKKEDVTNSLSKHDELFMKLLDSQMEEPRKKEYSEDCLYLNVYVPDGPALFTSFCKFPSALVPNELHCCYTVARIHTSHCSTLRNAFLAANPDCDFIISNWPAVFIVNK